MPSLFSQTEKDSLSSVFSTLHDTFSRPIYIFKQRDETIITENPNHNFLWESAPSNTETQSVIVSGVFNARILYGKEQKQQNFVSPKIGGAEDQNSSRLEMGEVRIKLDATGAAFLGGAQRVKFDDEVFQITSSKRPHGLFEPKWYTFFLKKLN
jgi:hypothetical protein